MKKTTRHLIGLLVLISLGTINSANQVWADDVQTGQDVGVRVWYASWKSGPSDYGFDPLFLLYYDLSINRWLVTAMAGYGKGWDLDADRIDAQAWMGRAIGPFVFGMSYHYVNFSYDKTVVYSLEQTVDYNMFFYYHGPELLVTGSIPFGDTGFSGSGSVTYLPYVFIKYNADEIGGDYHPSGDGHTWGYSYEIALHYSVKILQLSAGYRARIIEGTDFDDGGTTDGDNFAGPYAELGIMW